MKPLRKVIFPIAGLGKRLMPITRSISKDMIPIAGKPLILYAINEAIEAGCDTLIFILQQNQDASKNYIYTALENHKISTLQNAENHISFESSNGDITSNLRCIFRYQTQPLGLGHAVFCAKGLIEESESFAISLPDDLIDIAEQNLLLSMEKVRREYGGNVIAVQNIASKDTKNMELFKLIKVANV
jgi:UTP--glucose-1-phosphate uridylyltransferase